MSSTLTINGQQIMFEDGKSILEVARDNGFYIPSLCYHRKTGPASRCRVCVVEVEGLRGLQTACSVLASPGMVIKTETPEIIDIRKTIVNLLLADGQHQCLACEASGSCELQDAAYHLGIETSIFSLKEAVREKDTSSEMIVRDPNKCILCGRCIDACNNVVVNEVLGFSGRSQGTEVVCDYNLPMGKSSCVQCGECVQICPVGALVDKKSIGKGRIWSLEQVNSTCPYCGVGCQVTLHIDRAKNRIAFVTGRETEPNDGMLCVKGRYGYEFPSSENRLKYPMIKKNGKHERVSWEEALDYTAAKIKEIVQRDGADVFSAFGSGRITNENNYALMKFTRAVIKTNNVDHCART